MTTGFTIRELAADVDFEPLHRTFSALFPHVVFSPAGIRGKLESIPERALARQLVAEVDGELAGWTLANLHFGTAREGIGALNLVVAQAHQSRGIGAALLAESLAHLRRIGANEVHADCSDNPHSVAFAERHEFARGERMRFSRADLSLLPPQPATPGGVRLISAAEAGPEAVYAIDAVTVPDIPNAVPVDHLPWDEWLTMFWQGIDHQPKLGVVALVKDATGAEAAAAVTKVDADFATARSWSSFTGVLPQYRGMGLAKLVKSESLRRCAANGITAAYTANRSDNAPMLAANEWLGYRPVAGSWSCVKHL